MTAAHITADELLQKLELGDDFVLVDALDPMVYAHSHLPTAINLPPLAVDAPSAARSGCRTSARRSSSTAPTRRATTRRRPRAAWRSSAAWAPARASGKPYAPNV